MNLTTFWVKICDYLQNCDKLLCFLQKRNSTGEYKNYVCGLAMLPVDPRLEANAWHINIQKNNAVFCVKTQKYRRFLSKYLLLSKKNCNFAHNLDIRDILRKA